jgi:hypothetical protein
MEHLRGLVEKDVSGSGCRVTFTGMEYTDGRVEENIMENGKRINKKVTDI